LLSARTIEGLNACLRQPDKAKAIGLTLDLDKLTPLATRAQQARVAFLGAESASTNQHFFGRIPPTDAWALVIGDDFSSKWLSY